MFKNIHIETERLLIRDFRIADAEDIYQAWSDPEVMEFFPVKSLGTVDEAKREIERLIRYYDENTPERLVRLSLAVAEKEHDKVIGWTGFTWLDFDHSEVEIMYGFARIYWGKGYASETAKAVLDYGFREIGLEKIIGLVKDYNPASVKVIEKLGMKFEKKIEGLDHVHSFYEGVLYYSLTRDEYMEMEV